MFKEVLQIIPKLSSGDLANMERSLGSRFTRIAKKFGKGLTTTLMGGGIAGLALGLIDKILNPLKETQDAIDRVLKQGDDLVTNAKQFGTTAGKLFRLQQLAKSTGLEPQALMVLLEKFQTSLAEAKADPTKQTSVRNYVGSKDTAEAFFEFIQALQKMEKNQQVLVQQEIFGEKQILKMADFLQTDFGWQQKLLGGPSADKMTPKLEKLGNLNDFKDVLEANREMVDTMKKADLIKADMIRMQDERARLDLDKENRQVQSYKDLAQISSTMTELGNMMKDVTLGLTSMILKFTELNTYVKKMADSNVMRGIIKYFGGGK